MHPRAAGHGTSLTTGRTRLNWEHLLALPATLMLLMAALLGVVGLVGILGARRPWRERRRLAAWWRLGMVLIWLLLAAVLALGGWSLRGYRRLVSEAPVVTVDARILSPQRWALTLTWPDGSTREIQLAGDAFRIEAIVLKWKLPALLAGVSPLYRLDRLDGRYDQATQEASAPRTVVDFNRAGEFDLIMLRKRFPQWLPEVDAVYGSGAFLPLVNGGHYQVSLMRTGALVARPDATTAQRLSESITD